MTYEALNSKQRGTLLESGYRAYDDRISWNGMGVLTKIWQAYISYWSHRAGRQHVNKLSDHLLADIGVTRQEAEELDRRSLRDT
ncbi:DUF1127 domain-containing protein [Phyllobacterium sp. LjRoot231]|uniref:DUF1127 domain-containing protein n=1 Tax=Phyllobacterium sp. LjRoot231 TaxID=3342289 RepID=UPI003ECD207C